MSLRERVDENLRLMAEQSVGQLALNTAIVIGVLALLTVIGWIPLGGLIGGTIGYVAVQAWARLRHRRVGTP
jgi:hypothetical protein